MKYKPYFWSQLAHFLLEWEMFQTKVAEKIKAHILCSVTIFFLKNHAFYEIMLNNNVEPTGHKWQYGAC